MSEKTETLKLVRQSASKKILFLPHAIRQMSKPDRMIRTDDTRKAIEEGEIIENYSEDIRGHSCLILNNPKGDRPLHVVCSPKTEYLVIITAYIPNSQEWENNFRKRKKP